MPRYNRRGNTGVYFCATLTNPAAPTVAQVNAGVPLHPALAATSGFTSEQNDLPVPDISDDFDKTIPGGETPAASSLTFWSGDVNADVEETIRAAMVEGANGFVVWVKRSKVPAALTPVDVYPVRIKATNEQYGVENAGAQFMTGFSIPNAPIKHVNLVA